MWKMCGCTLFSYHSFYPTDFFHEKVLNVAIKNTQMIDTQHGYLNFKVYQWSYVFEIKRIEEKYQKKTHALQKNEDVHVLQMLMYIHMRRSHYALHSFFLNHSFFLWLFLIIFFNGAAHMAFWKHFGIMYINGKYSEYCDVDYKSFVHQGLLVLGPSSSENSFRFLCPYSSLIIYVSSISFLEHLVT